LLGAYGRLSSIRANLLISSQRGSPPNGIVTFDQLIRALNFGDKITAHV